MSVPITFGESNRTRPVLVAVVLLVGSILPVPFGRHAAFERVGPDKLLHLLGHGWFAATVADALGSGRLDRHSRALLAVGLSTGYAVLLGRLQKRVPGREPERADLVASLLGSVLGVIGPAGRSPGRSRPER